MLKIKIISWRIFVGICCSFQEYCFFFLFPLKGKCRCQETANHSTPICPLHENISLIFCRMLHKIRFKNCLPLKDWNQVISSLVQFYSLSTKFFTKIKWYPFNYCHGNYASENRTSMKACTLSYSMDSLCLWLFVWFWFFACLYQTRMSMICIYCKKMNSSLFLKLPRNSWTLSLSRPMGLFWMRELRRKQRLHWTWNFYYGWLNQ